MLNWPLCSKCWVMFKVFNICLCSKCWFMPAFLRTKITFLRVIPTMTCQDMSRHIFGHFLNIFWHSIWRIFWLSIWLSIWQSIWHIFWPSTWLGIRHCIRHSFEWRNTTKQQVVLVSRFVSFWFPHKNRMHKLMHTHPGFRNGLLTNFFWSFCQGTLPN